MNFGFLREASLRAFGFATLRYFQQIKVGKLMATLPAGVKRALETRTQEKNLKFAQSIGEEENKWANILSSLKSVDSSSKNFILLSGSTYKLSKTKEKP